MIKAKIFLQNWASKNLNGTKIATSRKGQMETLRDCLNDLTNVRIQRYIFDSIKLLEELQVSLTHQRMPLVLSSILRVLRSEPCEGVIACSKSKVAPLKSVTIPRLELCAAELLSKLIQSCVIP
ncbi:hypothetical protein AVEN_82155-1 [Araneus ventricosus]|uniref:Uncharacterized protein n=1 Tax=Araneus ventricosus TaxID=182803 RepID=A0A4Y2FY98_ARAVE|nr:hypothetical protein AVEN_82155-1 [Araneus ventricosus]